MYIGEKITNYIGEGKGAPEFSIKKEIDYSAYQYRSFDGYPGKVFFSGITAETIGLVIIFRQEYLEPEELEQLKQGKTVVVECQDWNELFDRCDRGGGYDH